MTAAKTEDTGPLNLAPSYRAAEAVIKDRAKSFYRAFSRLNEERFNAVAAVYAFCRYADDLVDDTGSLRPQAETEKLLDGLESAVLSLYGSQKKTAAAGNGTGTDREVRNELWWPAFSDTVHRFAIPKDGFLAQIRGQRLDLHFKDIQTRDELIEYCRLVAGSVGLMLAPVLADKAQAAQDGRFLCACENLGIGMQITNILRDVGEDILTRNRLYLPQNMMSRHNLTKHDIKNIADTSLKGNIEVPSNFRALWEQLAMLGNGFYTDCEKYLMYFQSSCRLSVAAASLIYHSIEDEVRKNGYNCFSKRCASSKLTKFKLIIKAKKIIRQTERLQAPKILKDG